MLRNCTINHVAAFLTPHEKQYASSKDETTKQVQLKIGHEVGHHQKQPMQKTAWFIEGGGYPNGNSSLLGDGCLRGVLFQGRCDMYWMDIKSHHLISTNRHI